MGGWRAHRVVVEARHAVDALFGVVEVGGERSHAIAHRPVIELSHPVWVKVTKGHTPPILKFSRPLGGPRGMLVSPTKYRYACIKSSSIVRSKGSRE
eukprot:scaffold1693_cov109-Isochrysis_galbana.AAC.1